jgi:hypothetical protein
MKIFKKKHNDNLLNIGNTKKINQNTNQLPHVNFLFVQPFFFLKKHGIYVYKDGYKWHLQLQI